MFIIFVRLMVLCPFIYVYTSGDSPSLKPQPTEVASIHWISLRALLSSSLRTHESVDVSDRFAKQGGPLLRIICRSIIGRMKFPAIHLVPTESVYSSFVPGFIPEDKKKLHQLWNKSASSGDPNPLLMWGLTLGVLGDLLDRLPPYNATKLWIYPTFTTPDLRLIAMALTYQVRKRNMLQLRSHIQGNQTAVDSQSEALPVAKETDENVVEEGPKRLDWRSSEYPYGGYHALGVLLSGYYDQLRLAVLVFLAWRVAATGIVAFSVWRFLRRRRA